MPDVADQVHILPKPPHGPARAKAAAPKGGAASRVAGFPTQFRKSVRVACNNCRSKKVACDANRPQCAQCVKRKAECFYVTEDANETPTAAVKRAHASIQKDYNDLSELVAYLRSAPDTVCTQILKYLRTNLSPVAILATMREFSPDHTAPAGREIPQVAPMSHVSAAGVDHSPMQPQISRPKTNIVNRSSLLMKPPLGNILDLSSGAATGSTSLNSPSLSSCTSHQSRGRPPYGSLPEVQVVARLPASEGVQADTYTSTVDPHSIPAYSDERLHQLQINHWTSVPISNEFAANAICFCMETNRDALGLLDSDLFIHDLVFWGNMSCSSLLVNSLLSWALRAYIGLVPNMTPMSLAFAREAQALWIGNQVHDSLPDAIALGLLGLHEDSQGHLVNGAKWRDEAHRMAGRMGLVDLFGELVESMEPTEFSFHN